MNAQRNNNMWKTRSLPTDAPKAPYIPQPDYTPLPTRRADSCQIQSISTGGKGPQRKQQELLHGSNSIGVKTVETTTNIPRIDEKSRMNGRSTSVAAEMLSVESSQTNQRVWHHPQWHSSQFLANDWNAALMKRLSVEAKTHREEKILREANKELERFESEIESYLEQVDEEEED